MSVKKFPPIIAVAIVIFFSAVLAGAQAPTLQEQLQAQYKVTKMGSDSSGPVVVDAGTLLQIQKGGIMGVAFGDTNVQSTRYEGGVVKAGNSMLSKGLGFGMKKFGAKEQTTHLFQPKDKVYATKVETNLAKDTVTVGIVACDKCNNTDPPTGYKANVVFQFLKGTLDKASAGEVEDVIGQLLAISNDDDQQAQGNNQQGNNQQGGGQGGQGGQGGGQGGGDQGQQQEPQTIEKGMTPDQVTDALGKPDKIVNLGAKQLYIYKDIKVTFLNGKVTDVQ